MQQEAPVRPRTTVAVEWVGPHLLLHGDDDPARERSFLARLTGRPGHVLIVPTRELYRHRTLPDELLAVLPPALAEIGVEAVWLAIEGLARTELPERLSGRLGADVLVPGGGLAFAVGSGVYVGPASGGSGWWRFRDDVPPWSFSSRYPLPVWEGTLPAEPVAADGLVADPVLAGVLVRAEDAGPVEVADAAFRVVLSTEAPRAVVGGRGPVPGPEATAALLGRLGPGVADRLVVVPAVTAPARPEWLRALAAARGAPVLASAGAPVAAPDGGVATVVLDDDGAVGFGPFPTLLRQHPGGAQEVVEAAAPPPGWLPLSPLAYRPDVPEDHPARSVRAEVRPGGLVVTTAAPGAAEPHGPVTTFDPASWTLDVGRPGEPVGDVVASAADYLVRCLDPARAVRARANLAGSWTGSDRALLDRLVPGAVTPDVSKGPFLTPGDRNAPSITAPAAGVVAGPARGEPVVSKGPFLTPGDSNVPSITARPGADETVPVARVAATAPGADVDEAPPAPAPAELPEVAPLVTVSADPEPTALPPGARPAGSSPAESPGGAAAGLDGPTVVVTPPEEAPPEPVPTSRASQALEVPERDSTAREHGRFAAAAGESFTEALSSVNAALATWPALRTADPGAKADYAAVVLFVGDGGFGTAGLNGAVRAGHDGPVDGHLPCLVSGLRRLPIHRRAVLRQGLGPEPADLGGLVGRVLVEPAFLTGSTDLDVTVPDAGYDVLIWPASARRTSELLVHRPVAEAVFAAGARFTVLAVRAATEPVDPDAEEATAPRTALLLRELPPGEPGRRETSEPDERDQAAIARLDRALARRHGGAVRLVDDAALAERLAAPAPGVAGLLLADGR